MAYSLSVTDRSTSTKRTSGGHLFTRMQTSFVVEGRVGTLLQYHGMVVETIFGDEHDRNLCYNASSLLLAFPCKSNCKWSSNFIMHDDDQNEGANEDLLGGIEDVDNSMMETMYNLSAYVSGSNNDEDDDVESDDDASGQCGVRNNCQDAASRGWTYLTGSNRPEVSISIDGIDNRLLDRAREEVPAVLLNLKKRIGSRRDRDVCTISPGDCLKAFMDPNFLGYMKAYINANMRNSNDLVSSSDIIAFIRVELMISFYKVRTWDVNASNPRVLNVINGLTGNLPFCSRPSSRFPPLCTLILQTHQTSLRPPVA